MQPEWLPLLPFLFLAGGGTAVFCLGAFRSGQTPGLTFSAAILACIAAAVAALLPLPAYHFVPFLDLDGYSRFYTVLFAAITGVTLLFSRQYAVRRNFSGDEYPGILLFATLGMTIVAAAVHWLIFFLGLELLSISLYILLAMRRDNQSAEAAIKYFILGAVASSFLVFGIALLYAGTGTLSLYRSLELSGREEGRLMILLGLGFILVGIGFKVSLVPFHLWTPDVYQGAPAPVTAFLATGSKVALFALFVRLALHSPDTIRHAFFPYLWITAVLTMTVGNITALVQDSVKRLLAYSSIAHMGYMLMALLAVQNGGAAAVIFYSVVYAVSDLGSFGALGLLSPVGCDRDHLDNFRGLGYSHPGRTALLALSLFSLAGLPATAGFIGKFVVFQPVFARNLIVLGLIGIGTAIISLYFYLRVAVALYLQPTEDTDPDTEKPDHAAVIACVAVAAAILWLGLFPSSLLNVITCIVSG